LYDELTHHSKCIITLGEGAPLVQGMFQVWNAHYTIRGPSPKRLFHVLKYSITALINALATWYYTMNLRLYPSFTRYNALHKMLSKSIEWNITLRSSYYNHHPHD
jgi:hypothetical protein